MGNIQSLLSYIHRENDGEVYEKAYALDTALKDHKKKDLDLNAEGKARNDLKKVYS